MLRRESIAASEHGRRNGAGRHRGALVLVENGETRIPRMAIHLNQPLATSTSPHKLRYSTIVFYLRNTEQRVMQYNTYISLVQDE